MLRKFRDHIGLSQEALAREIGCAVNTVRRAERGEREPLLTYEQWENLHAMAKKAKFKLPKKLSDKVAI